MLNPLDLYLSLMLKLDLWNWNVLEVFGFFLNSLAYTGIISISVNHILYLDLVQYYITFVELLWPESAFSSDSFSVTHGQDVR